MVLISGTVNRAPRDSAPGQPVRKTSAKNARHTRDDKRSPTASAAPPTASAVPPTAPAVPPTRPDRAADAPGPRRRPRCAPHAPTNDGELQYRRGGLRRGLVHPGPRSRRDEFRRVTAPNAPSFTRWRVRFAGDVGPMGRRTRRRRSHAQAPLDQAPPVPRAGAAGPRRRRTHAPPDQPTSDPGDVGRTP